MQSLSLVPEDQFAAIERRINERENSACPQLWTLLDEVKDPEIPVLSIWDLGVLHSIEQDQNSIRIVITPTYSGCPAMQEIQQDIQQVLARAGYQNVEVSLSLSPAWSTAWISEKGRQQLLDYGIAPPIPLTSQEKLSCPQCNSQQVAKISEFGSTPCKALYRCEQCLEPFDYFKCL